MGIAEWTQTKCHRIVSIGRYSVTLSLYAPHTCLYSYLLSCNINIYICCCCNHFMLVHIHWNVKNITGINDCHTLTTCRKLKRNIVFKFESLGLLQKQKNESEINHWSGSGRRWKGATMLLYKKWKLHVKISCHNTPSSISYLDASNGQYTPFGLTSTGPSTGEKYIKHCCTTTNQLYTVTCLCLPS